jgi:hypothetical protein
MIADPHCGEGAAQQQRIDEGAAAFVEVDEARIHLILDYVVPGERIEDPDGVFFA